jgi:beta-phosphoglucomutase-like phosphatase (HAD superfamily)
MFALKRFLPTPNHNKNVLIIEDSINGIERAIAFGMQTVFLYK